MIKCIHCGFADLEIKIHKFNGGEHHQAFCLSCGKFSHNVSHQPQRFYFGKFKGKLVEEVSDLGYLHWFLKEIKPKPSMKEAIIMRIEQLEHAGR